MSRERFPGVRSGGGRRCRSLETLVHRLRLRTSGVRHVVLTEGDTVHLTPAGHVPSYVAVRHEHGTVTVTSYDTETVVPDVPGPVHVLVDGPVVEVCTGSALIGFGTGR